MAELGTVLVLNGAPRSGKSSIVAEVQRTFPGLWLNLGEDRYLDCIPEQFLPALGLRPGGEAPHLEDTIVTLYATFFAGVAAHSRHGVHTVLDMGLHDSYSRPLGIHAIASRELAGLPAWFVGVRCPLPVILERRQATGYLAGEGGEVPAPILRWQEAVHRPGIYDLEVDTAQHTASQCADLIRQRLESGEPPSAWSRLASL